ncbi:MAG: type II toxin-antitoxin system VapC family toxin [Thermoanaerobaculia bacterium]
MIVVDTSALVDSLAGPRRSAARMRALLAEGERLVVPALVLYEWWRGPRRESELAAQEALFPRDVALAFGPAEAAVAARLYGAVARPRGRELDLAIAAHAMVLDAVLWTLNPKDFVDLPDLRLAG